MLVCPSTDITWMIPGPEYEVLCICTGWAIAGRDACECFVELFGNTSDVHGQVERLEQKWLHDHMKRSTDQV